MTVEINETKPPITIGLEQAPITRQVMDLVIIDDVSTELDERVWSYVINGTGPQGPPGPPGPSAGAFIHEQSTPSAVWTVVHNRNRSVSVTVYDASGCVVRAAVVEISPNVAEVRANSPFSGRAVIL